MDFIDAKEFDDPQLFDERQLFDDQLEVWTLIIQKSTVIPPSPMVLFSYISALRGNHFWRTHQSPDQTESLLAMTNGF